MINDLQIKAGVYVLAVSGGVDSMVLLDILAKPANSREPVANSRPKPKAESYQLVVAHFNHGIRGDSDEDEQLVTKSAAKYKLPLEIGRTKLGVGTSEEKARQARYEFLYRIKEKRQARAIITAHHQDDLIETALINILRGTGRRGPTAMAQNPDIIRPLLNTPKSELVQYAKAHKLDWREDVTNKDTRYLRNYIRLKVVPRLSASQRQELLAHITELNRLNPVLDLEIANLSQSLLFGNKIKRQKFISLPAEIAAEVLTYLLRQENIRRFDRKTIDRLAVAIKTAKPGTKHDILKRSRLKVDKDFAEIQKI